MDRKPKIDHERIIYLTVDFAIDMVINVAKGLFQEIGRKIDNYPAISDKELIETSKYLIARIDIQGVPKEYINIDLSENKLELSYSKTSTEKRSPIKKLREIRLPKSVVVDKSTADLEDGLLTVKMPKKVRRIKYEVK